MRQHFLRDFALRTDSDRDSIDILAKILALLANLLLLFVVVRRNLVDVFYTIYLLVVSPLCVVELGNHDSHHKFLNRPYMIG